MPAKNIAGLKGASLLAVALLALTGARGAEPTDEFPVFDSYLKFGALGASINGNEPAFQRRTQQPANGNLGIEDMYLTKDLENNVGMTLDGHALFFNQDYLGKLVLSKQDVGSFEMGYKTFRTYYDGIGGFFPISKQWNVLNPEDQHIDRGEFWVGAKIARPDLPVFEIRYSDGFRRGTKDDTIWGDSDFTGLPNNNPPISQVRKMVPSYRAIDEKHQILDASVEAKMFGNTTAKLALTWDSTHNDDTRYNVRYPGEVKPYPTPPSTTLLPPSQMNNQVVFTQDDGQKTDSWAIRLTTDTVFNDKLTLKVGGYYEDLSSDFTGNRPLTTATPTAVGVVQAPSNNYLNLAGTSHVDIYTGLVALEWKPTPNNFVKFGLAGEDRYTKSNGTYVSVTSSVNTTTGVVTITNTNQVFNSRVKENSLTPQLDWRYSGFNNVALYASVSQKTVNGDQRYVTPHDPALAATNSQQALNSADQRRIRANLGATWRTAKWLELRGEVFTKDNDNNYDGYLVRTDGFVDTYHLDYIFTGFKGTAILRLDPTLTLTTRYVYQEGTAKVKGTYVNAGVLTNPVEDAMDAQNHMIGETIDWVPNSTYYVQVNLNLVFNTINTIYPRAGTTPASGSNIAFDSNGVLQNSNNDYFNGSLVAGAVLNKNDDLLFQCFYYKTDNYDPYLANLTMPYGAGAEESQVTLGIKHKFNARMFGEAKVGYIDSKNDTTGGNTNFHGPLGYVSLTLAL